MEGIANWGRDDPYFTFQISTISMRAVPLNGQFKKSWIVFYKCLIRLFLKFPLSSHNMSSCMLNKLVLLNLCLICFRILGSVFLIKGEETEY